MGSDELRLSPKVVRSEPSARVFRSYHKITNAHPQDIQYLISHAYDVKQPKQAKLRFFRGHARAARGGAGSHRCLLLSRSSNRRALANRTLNIASAAAKFTRRGVQLAAGQGGEVFGVYDEFLVSTAECREVALGVIPERVPRSWIIQCREIRMVVGDRRRCVGVCECS